MSRNQSVFLIGRHVDYQLSPSKGFAIEVLDCSLCLRIWVHLNKTCTFRFSRFMVKKLGFLRLEPIFFQKAHEFLLIGIKAQVSEIQNFTFLLLLRIASITLTIFWVVWLLLVVRSWSILLSFRPVLIFTFMLSILSMRTLQYIVSRFAVLVVIHRLVVLVLNGLQNIFFIVWNIILHIISVSLSSIVSLLEATTWLPFTNIVIEFWRWSSGRLIEITICLSVLEILISLVFFLLFTFLWALRLGRSWTLGG